jgi:hypothetical protein
MKTTSIQILLLVITIWYSQGLSDDPSITAMIAPDSGENQIKVRELKLDFKFAGYGYYMPSNYPLADEIPLENGEIVQLENIAEATLNASRVQWKKFISEPERKNYTDIADDGYRHWSAIEVDVWLRDWDGNITSSRIKRPEYADVFLVGITQRGDFSLQIDQENNKTVQIIFEPTFILQCTKDKTHLFPNSSFQFCPYCGSKLKRINKPK